MGRRVKPLPNLRLFGATKMNLKYLVIYEAIPNTADFPIETDAEAFETLESAMGAFTTAAADPGIRVSLVSYVPSAGQHGEWLRDIYGYYAE